ncbi:unnamed protein product [Orchesella dallaii]|uniref:CCHC-type domain-containing protein n=1 Tax=Orchesella dallaii TaxID=48710 RepID=A0ABP1PY38_9HEXA
MSSRELKALLENSKNRVTPDTTQGRQLRQRPTLDLNNKQISLKSKTTTEKDKGTAKNRTMSGKDSKTVIPPIIVTPAPTPESEAGSSNMQTQSTTPVDADPFLKDLPLEQRKYISSLLAVQRSFTNIRVVQSSDAINIPYYDADKTTAEAFIHKCTIYFRSQGFEAEKWHEYMGLILKREQKIWYDSVIHSIDDFSAFVTAFQERYDNSSVKEARRRQLYNRKQKLSESVEQFTYEMVNLARQVFPEEEEKLSVLRAKNGLIPDLRLYIGDCTSINELLEKAGYAISAIRARDNLNGIHTRLPPLHGFGFRDSTSRGQNPRNSNQMQNNGRNNFNNQQNGRQFRERVYSDPPRIPRDKTNVVCRLCRKTGHYARECTESEKPQVPNNDQRDGQNNDTQGGRGNNANNNSNGNLNSERGARYFGRGASQY